MLRSFAKKRYFSLTLALYLWERARVRVRNISY